MNPITRKRLQRKFLKQILFGVNGLLTLGDQAAVIYFVDDAMRTNGHLSITSLVAPMQEAFQTHPDFLNREAVGGDVSLPESPVIDKSFTYKKAKDFFKDTKILEKVLGTKRPGYGNIEKKPSWWQIEWKNVNSKGFSKEHLYKLIIDMYAHHDIEVVVGVKWNM